MKPTETERLNRVFEATLLNWLWHQNEAQKKLNEQLRFVQ